MKKRFLLRILAVFCVMALTMLVFRRIFPEGEMLPAMQQLDPGLEIRQYDFLTSIFNTDCRLSLFGTRQQVHTAYRRVSEELFRLHNALNRFNRQSEVSRFNAAPANTPFPCSPQLWRAFETAEKAYQETDGAFDITVGPLMAFWKKHATDAEIPQEELASIRQHVGFSLLKLDAAAHSVTKLADDLQVDFGGLAKGLALDIARETLQAEGVENCYLDFGGNTYQNLPQDHPYRDLCAIKDLRPLPDGSFPSAPRCTLQNAERRFLGTSANSYRAISKDDAKPVGHILDPQTGMPVAPAYISLTAIADTGWRSDAFSTAVFAKGAPLARIITAAHPACAFIFLPQTDAAPEIIGDARLQNSSSINP